MDLSLKSTLAIVSSLSFYALVAAAGQNDVRGAITLQNVDCPWYRGSFFAAQMLINYSEDCNGYATIPRVIHEGEGITWNLPFGANGNCRYKISGSVNALPIVARNQLVIFKMYYGECRATVINK